MRCHFKRPFGRRSAIFFSLTIFFNSRINSPQYKVEPTQEKTRMPEHNGPSDHPMDEIAKQFKGSARPSQNQPPSGTLSSVEPSGNRFETAGTNGFEPESPPTAQTTVGPLSLSPDQIEAPSFFVDKKLSVVWTNPSGTDPFTRALDQESRSPSTPNIFELLLKPAVKDAIADWQALFSFIYIVLRRSTDQDTFGRGTVSIASNHLPATDEASPLSPAIHPFRVDSCIIGQKDESSQSPRRLFALEFKQGTLFLLRQDQWHSAVTAHRETESALDDIGGNDEKGAVCVLSARLNDSHRIADTMLPEFFFKLMHRIWDEGDSVVRSFGGKRVGCGGAQIDYMFTRNAGRNPIFSAICCATRMNRQMHVVQEKIRAQQGWSDEILMNMGISHGTDELSTLSMNGCMESTIPGGTFDQSSQLSAIAGKGEIWITRNAVAQLPRKLIDQVVVGVDRQGRFLRNFFTRLSDMPLASGTGQPHPDLGNLSIARVLTIEKPGPEHPAANEV
jgi:class 3 adenylate cyclase